MKTWSKKRKLFLIDVLVVEAASVTAIVLLLLGSHNLSRDVTIAVAMILVSGAHLILRFTYFKSVGSEIREERARRKSLPVER